MRCRFEAQLAAVKERLEAAKLGAARGMQGNAQDGAFGAGFMGGSRIAKPLRGGGGPNMPNISNLQAQEMGQSNQGSPKRGSWFAALR